jgi:hypothetical protein
MSNRFPPLAAPLPPIPFGQRAFRKLPFPSLPMGEIVVLCILGLILALA